MAENKQVVKPGGGTVTVRQDLGEQISVNHELSTAAAAAAAKAEMEARMVLARMNPRDEEQAREDALKACRRPGFAAEAEYRKPVGRKKNAEGKWEQAFAEGLSIRAIEAFLQYWGNVYTSSTIVFEDADRALLRVTTVDVQRNVGFATDATIEKLVERKEVKAGRKTRGMRENSYGEVVYLVEATHDEFRNALGAERSKLIRDNGRRLLPSDILEEARAIIKRTVADENAKDPDSAKKKILDRFAAIGVSATMLKEYLERPVETLTVKDLNELSVLHNGLKEGDFNWADVMRSKEEPAEGETPTREAPRKLRDRLMPQPDPKPTDQPQENEGQGKLEGV
jgi:hypothetical protein